MKLPAIMLYTGDWRKDPQLSKCRPETRGIWIDAVCAMHDDDRSGILSGSFSQLASVCRCTATEMRRAVNDLRATKAAHVTVCNKQVILVNRRMQRERKDREQGRFRVRRHRETAKKQKCNASLSYSTSISVAKEGKEKLPPSVLILRHDELKRAEKQIEKLWAFKSEWTADDKKKFAALKARRKDLMEILGMHA